MTIYNQFGQRVLQTDEIVNKIDISLLRQGIYIVEIVYGNIRTRNKLIIKD